MYLCVCTLALSVVMLKTKAPPVPELRRSEKFDGRKPAIGRFVCVRRKGISERDAATGRWQACYKAGRSTDP
jgi:hypothetical protein